MSSKAAGHKGSPPSSADSDRRQPRSHRPTPESQTPLHAERPNKKQRTAQSNDENMDDQRLLRANREIARPGLLAITDHRSFMIPDRPSPPYRPPDEDGYYVCELGDNLSSRYKVLARIGEGSFGRVLECWDRKKKEYVAIKVIRNIDKYRNAAMIELEVLNTLQANDPEGKRHCVAIHEWFDYRGHVCMVFERLGPSLYDFLRKSDYRPLPLPLVQQFGCLLLEAVAYMHEIKLIHTDLKPENILLERDGVEQVTSTPALKDHSQQERRDRRLSLKVPTSKSLFVIDFGSATFDDQYHSGLVSTRHYRAPEVILGLGWSYPCDMWSMGCILVELVTGEAMFQTHENLEHMAMMEKLLGPIPEKMSRNCSKAMKKYFEHGRLFWPEGASSRKSVRAVRKLSNLKDHIENYVEGANRHQLQSLIELLQKMLEYDPSQRITAREALGHAFFKSVSNGRSA